MADRSEQAILDPDLPIIDAHHHLFDRPALRYLLNDYLADVGAGHRIVASVYVETQAFVRADGPPLLRPLGADALGTLFLRGWHLERVSSLLVEARGRLDW